MRHQQQKGVVPVHEFAKIDHAFTPMRQIVPRPSCALRRLRYAAVGSLILLFVGCSIAAGGETAIPVTGESEPQLATIDGLMLQFLREESAPGASVAIT